MPNLSAEVISQLLYGEEVELLETNDIFARVCSLCDRYEGWVLLQDLMEGFYETNGRVTGLFVNVYREPIINCAPLFTIPFGTTIKIVQRENRFAQVQLVDQTLAYLFTNKITDHLRKSWDEVIELSLQFLNLPYLWGGKDAAKGFDCSGFVQMLYRERGIFLPRDSYMQEREGVEVSLENLEKGDLIFFARNQKIDHVAICMSRVEFIHAVGGDDSKVQIDSLENLKWSQLVKSARRWII